MSTIWPSKDGGTGEGGGIRAKGTAYMQGQKRRKVVA